MKVHRWAGSVQSTFKAHIEREEIKKKKHSFICVSALCMACDRCEKLPYGQNIKSASKQNHHEHKCFSCAVAQ